MKIKFGALVVDGRGKLGGHVASANRGGAYLRTKVTPSNPQTIYQSIIRAIWGAISQAWSGLTEAEILGWNSAVPEWKTTNIFGDLKQPSGKNLHQKLNQNLLVAGYPGITSVPEKEAMVEGVVSAVAIDTTAETLTATGAYTGASARVVVFATPDVSAGTTFVKNRLRKIGAGLGSTYTPAQMYIDYVAKYGVPADGDRIFVGFKYVIPTGQASPLQTVLAVTTA